MRGAKKRYSRATPDLSQNHGFYKLAPGSGRSGGKGQAVAERQERPNEGGQRTGPGGGDLRSNKERLTLQPSPNSGLSPKSLGKEQSRHWFWSKRWMCEKGRGRRQKPGGRGLAGGMTGLGEPREVGATSGNAGPPGNRHGALGKEEGGTVTLDRLTKTSTSHSGIKSKPLFAL